MSVISDLDPNQPTDQGQAGLGDDELRNIKSALVTCLGGVDGEIQNADGDQPTAADFTALFAAVAGLSGQQTFQTGMVMPYYTAGSAIPDGWALCDGGTYQGATGAVTTPDLRGRFLIGGNPGQGFEYGEFGGALPGQQTTGPAGAVTATVTVNPHTIGVNNLPEHRHALLSGAAGSGSGTQGNPALPDRSVAHQWATGSVSNNYVLQDDAGNNNPTLGRTGNAGQSSPDQLTHDSANVDIPDHSHTLDGASLPPYFVLRYIMYIGVAA